jgi:site-specific DNA-methyltransferase (adenine-specific)
MAAMPEGSIPVICCDPPYGLEFMGKEWDKLGTPAWEGGGGFSKPGIGERNIQWPSFSATSRFGATNPTCAVCGGRLRGARQCSCPMPHDHWKPIGKRRNPENEGLPDTQTVPGMGRQLKAMQEWHTRWLTEALRVLQPGGRVKVFGGTRTFHRLAVAMTDIGFIDVGMETWAYSSGFPKSHDVSKGIDRVKGAVREVIGFKRGVGGENLNDIVRGQGAIRSTDDEGGKGLGAYGVGAKQIPVDVPITLPATPEAQAWEGWGTALKPAWEPILVGRKPA